MYTQVCLNLQGVVLETDDLILSNILHLRLFHRSSVSKFFRTQIQVSINGFTRYILGLFSSILKSGDNENFIKCHL